MRMVSPDLIWVYGGCGQGVVAGDGGVGVVVVIHSLIFPAIGTGEGLYGIRGWAVGHFSFWGFSSCFL